MNTNTAVKMAILFITEKSPVRRWIPVGLVPAKYFSGTNLKRGRSEDKPKAVWALYTYGSSFDGNTRPTQTQSLKRSALSSGRRADAALAYRRCSNCYRRSDWFGSRYYRFQCSLCAETAS